MKATIPPLATLALCALLAGCGSANAPSQSASVNRASASSPSKTPSASLGTAASGAYLESDADQDGDDPYHRGRAEDDDTPFLRSYGPQANPTDRSAIAALLKRYYAAAAAGDGAAACQELSATLALGLTAGQSGATCASVVTPLLAEQRQRFAADQVASMVLIQARVKNGLGLAEVGFKAAPISQIVVKREHGTWKVDALFDSLMR